MAYRTGWSPHLVAGTTEDDYVSDDLADEVTAAIEQALLAEDRQQQSAPPVGRPTRRR